MLSHSVFGLHKVLLLMRSATGLRYVAQTLILHQVVRDSLVTWKSQLCCLVLLHCVALVKTSLHEL
jgi:hypothetical protein